MTIADEPSIRNSIQRIDARRLSSSSSFIICLLAYSNRLHFYMSCIILYRCNYNKYFTVVLGSCWHWRSTSSRSASPWYSIKKERRLIRHGWADADGGRSSIRQTRSHGSPTPDTSYTPTQKQYTSVYYLIYLKWLIKLLSGLNLNFFTYFISYTGWV
jgi:hypothetical protein